ncbi:hypothetical protein LPB72_04800 [Hydrogenophaga crassostreae]|uniref:Uncharacterized protein n=1 Tax=Hydrogenophaga crassostreae TaxID=1763535 RepID=A0A163CKH8_9BURK|nr:hypothetical protein LPB072_19750 [Hydrogenophaga crassostreae]OAD43179.1 hypothetical protein LPB72_04800 [Hydrogenophaga crassostreae]
MTRQNLGTDGGTQQPYHQNFNWYAIRHSPFAIHTVLEKLKTISSANCDPHEVSGRVSPLAAMSSP